MRSPFGEDSHAEFTRVKYPGNNGTPNGVAVQEFKRSPAEELQTISRGGRRKHSSRAGTAMRGPGPFNLGASGGPKRVCTGREPVAPVGRSWEGQSPSPEGGQGNPGRPTGGTLTPYEAFNPKIPRKSSGKALLACQYWNKSPLPDTKELTGSLSPDGAYSPKYINACKQGAWSIVTWPVDLPEKAKVRRFKCRSWRHEGECAKWRGAQDFKRIEGALKSNSGFWVYMVFTFDRKEWRNEFEAYKGLLACWDKFRKRFERKFGKFQYIVLCEKHRDGWPHINILIRNEKFAEKCAGDGWRAIRKSWVKPQAIECGFGKIAWVEPVRDESAMAGYCVKLLKTIGEISKLNQAPVNAPKNFRRLRASQGLLPPPHKNPNITGWLEMEPFEKVEHKWERIKELLNSGGKHFSLNMQTGEIEEVGLAGRMRKAIEQAVLRKPKEKCNAGVDDAGGRPKKVYANNRGVRRGTRGDSSHGPALVGGQPSPSSHKATGPPG